MKGINSFRVSWRERVPDCIFCSSYCHIFCIYNHPITRIGGLPMMPVKGFWVRDSWLKTASWVQFVVACEMNAKILPIQTAQCIGTAYAFDVLFKTSCTCLHHCCIEENIMPFLHPLKVQHLWVPQHPLITHYLICTALLQDHFLTMPILDTSAYNAMDWSQEGRKAQVTRMRKLNHYEEVLLMMMILNLCVRVINGRSLYVKKDQKNIIPSRWNFQQLKQLLNLLKFVILQKMKMSALHVLKSIQKKTQK